MDEAERYLQLALLGRNAFVASSAPAALVRWRAEGQGTDSDSRTLDEEVNPLVALVLDRLRGPRGVEVYPLAKKPGASFADVITVGRTPINDVVLPDVSLSRFHAYFRQRDDKWIVADAGSKTGSELAGEPLEPRMERELASGTALRIGELKLTFYTAAELYGVLGGR